MKNLLKNRLFISLLALAIPSYSVSAPLSDLTFCAVGVAGMVATIATGVGEAVERRAFIVELIRKAAATLKETGRIVGTAAIVTGVAIRAVIALRTA